MTDAVSTNTASSTPSVYSFHHWTTSTEYNRVYSMQGLLEGVVRQMQSENILMLSQQRLRQFAKLRTEEYNVYVCLVMNMLTVKLNFRTLLLQSRLCMDNSSGWTLQSHQYTLLCNLNQMHNTYCCSGCIPQWLWLWPAPSQRPPQWWRAHTPWWHKQPWHWQVVGACTHPLPRSWHTSSSCSPGLQSLKQSQLVMLGRGRVCVGEGGTTGCIIM